MENIGSFSKLKIIGLDQTFHKGVEIMFIKGGLNHVTIRVKDLMRSDEFYSGLLGLKKVGSRPFISFYSSGSYNHELALVEDAGFDGKQTNGLLHLAFNVEDADKLSKLKDVLKQANVFVSEKVDHVISHSFYTQDPDGHVVELTVDQPQSNWGQNPNAFRKDYRLG